MIIWYTVLRYGAWRTYFVFILGNSLSFYPPDSPKKRLEISSFYTSVPKIMIIGFTVPEIWLVTDVILVFHFGIFFALLLSPLPKKSPKNQNFQKKKKIRGYIIILHMCTKYYYSMMFVSWDMLRDGRTEGRMDGRTDGRKYRHREVGAPPKNQFHHHWFPEKLQRYCMVVILSILGMSSCTHQVWLVPTFWILQCLSVLSLISFLRCCKDFANLLF